MLALAFVGSLGVAVEPARAAGVRNCVIILTESGRPDFAQDRKNLEALANALGLSSVSIDNPNFMARAIADLRKQGCNSITVITSVHGAPDEAFCPSGREEGTLMAGGGELPATEMKQLMAKNPGIAFNFVIEACFAERFYDGLKGAPNLGNVATSGSTNRVSNADERGSHFIIDMIRAWATIYDRPGNRGRAPTTFGNSIPQAFKLEVEGDQKVKSQNPRLFPRKAVVVVGGGGGIDICAIQPLGCFVSITVDGDNPGPNDEWGVGIVTVTPAPTSGQPTFAGEGEFAAGSWAAQFNSDYGCANGYTAVYLCREFSWNRTRTVTLTVHPVPEGGYTANPTPSDEAPAWTSVFIGWGGDCASAGTSTTCTLRVGRQRSKLGERGYDLDVTAKFAAAGTGIG